jgi:hypothetical protein
MWQSLTEQLGIAIPVIMILLSLVLPVAAAFFYVKHIGPGLMWQKQLRERLHKLSNLKGNSITHIQELRKILVSTEDTCLRPRVELLIEDSRELYEGKWLPEPSERIQPEHLNCPGWAQVERSAPAGLIAIAGTVITALMATAFWLYDPTLISDLKLLRIFISLPILIGLILSFFLAKTISTVQINTRRNWQELMLQLRRKFPVYSAEHETATLINGFLTYDRDMKESVAQLTEQISHFSSQQLTDAITSSVRSVMEKTVSGPVTDSYQKMTSITETMNEQLASINTQLQSQINTGKQELNKLYQNLMSKQEQLITNMADQLSSTHAALLEQQDSSWKAALMQLKETEQTTLNLLSERQSQGVTEMLDQTTASITEALNLHISPVAERLYEAADVLKIAHEYADQVQNSLEEQLKHSIEAQNRMLDATTELNRQQQSFASDVSELKSSTQEMTAISASLNNIFTKSQADLLQTVETFSSELGDLSGRMHEVIEATAGQHEQIMTMNEQVSQVSQKQIDAVSAQINHLSDELSTRIDQMLLGFTRMSEDMLKQVDSTVQNQNDTLGSSLRALTNTMEEEARSMSLYSQQITMDITSLSDSLRGAVGDFDQNIREELGQVLEQLDSQVAEILSRLTYTASELADAVEALPQALGSGK